MIVFNKKKNININLVYLLILFIFSFSINFYYAGLGSFPIDTFLHYDSSSRILKGELPIRDFWIVSGLTVDLFQSFFFKIFGVNWFAYIIHSSLFNSLMALIVYFFFLNEGLSNKVSLIFSLSFATLSYTVSGTPFVDLHASFLLLISTLLIINNFNSDKNYLWPIIIFLLFLSFFSKQVPVAYASLIYSIILIYYFLFKKDYKKIIISLISITILITLFYFFLKFCKIDFDSFYIQYIDYPRSIGSERLTNFNLTFESFFNKYKFIIIPFFILIFIHLKKGKNIEKKISFLILSSFVIILIFHQLMTKNQIYIYFLIPLLFGLIEKELQLSQIKYKRYFSYCLIILISLITIKYHLRFNENRKFHELTKKDIEQSIKAETIHHSLKGLYWKNPHFNGTTSNEVNLLNKAKETLMRSDYKKIMLITHYQFLDSITEKKLLYPNKTFTLDGASMPLIGNKHFENYKNFLEKKIIASKVDKVLFFKSENISKKVLTNYIGKDCYQFYESEIFYIYRLTCFK